MGPDRSDERARGIARSSAVDKISAGIKKANLYYIRVRTTGLRAFTGASASGPSILFVLSSLFYTFSRATITSFKPRKTRGAKTISSINIGRISCRSSIFYSCAR